jgi:hypothetical protein
MGADYTEFLPGQFALDVFLQGGSLTVTIADAARLIRWGKLVDPTWIHAVEQTAPGAGTALVTKAVTLLKKGYIYGFFIDAQETNDFLINWTSGGVAKSIRITFGGKGSMESVDPVPINEGLSADAGTNITITNVTAGGVGMIYQARLLYAEI